MLENEARHYWRTSVGLRLKPEIDEDHITEAEAMVLHSDHPQIRVRAAGLLIDTSLKVATA